MKKTIILFVVPLILFLSLIRVQALFTKEQVAAYVLKGPSDCYRHLCPAYNAFISEGHPIAGQFSKADPVAYAEFCKKINLDAALVLAVPHGGYCTYETQVGAKFPDMKGDWFGGVVKNLHERNISALGYITLGWNEKYALEHPEISLPPQKWTKRQRFV